LAAWPGQAGDSTNLRINIGVISSCPLPSEAVRPMGVSVLSKRVQQRLRLVGRPSVLGQGLLERARATFLGLLGLTAAVGLAIVAIALNQSWPLIAGSSIPQIPPRHQGVGQATVAIGGGIGDVGSEQANAVGGPRSDTTGQPAGHPGDAGPPPASSAPSESAVFVVSPSAPAEPPDDGSKGNPEPSPAPTVQPPKQAADAPASPTPSVPASPPAAPPTVVESTPPSATTAEAPASDPEVYVPSWSQGKGHAYGRSNDYGGDDDGDCDDGDDGGWDRGPDDFHGHHYDD
jgi:hypothetical protein